MFPADIRQPLKAQTRRNEKEKDHDQREERDQQEERREVQLRLRNLFLRVPHGRVHLPGEQLPVWLQPTRRLPVIAKASPAGIFPRAMLTRSLKRCLTP